MTKSFIPDRQSYRNGRVDTIEILLKWIKEQVKLGRTDITIRRLIIKLDELLKSGD